MFIHEYEWRNVCYERSYPGGKANNPREYKRAPFVSNEAVVG